MERTGFCALAGDGDGVCVPFGLRQKLRSFGRRWKHPFMAMLGARYPEAQFLITGVLGPASNAHGPNEFLHIAMTKKVTACVALILAAAADNLETHHE